MKIKEEMIKAIYEKVADKTLSFWCKIQEFYEWKNYTHIIINIVNKNEKYYYIRYEDWIWNFNKLTTKIIWHPVMFGDMVNYFEINNIKLYNEYFHNIVHFEWVLEKFTKLWKEKRKPIEEQSDDCIEEIYNLIKD